MARPSKYSDELATGICARIAAGEPLTRICRDEEMPDVATVYRWIAGDDKFREMYARAREDQADTLADEIIAIADDGINDTYVDSESGMERTNYDVIARSKLRVDARKWIAAKLKPKKYGDKVQQEITGQDGGPVKYERIERVIVDPK